MNNRTKLIIILVTALLTSFFLIEYLGKKLNNQLYNYVNIESKRIITNIVNDSINIILEENLHKDLFNVTNNAYGEVELLDYNMEEVNRILKLINQNIKRQLLNLEEGKTDYTDLAESFKKGKYKKVRNGIICDIPIGSLKNNAFYSNYGPYIPIKMSFQGSVNSKIKTNLTAYGFNSVVIEVFLISEIEQRISLPISSKTAKIIVEAPLTLKIIQGVIPQKYYEKQLEKNYPQYTS